MIVAIYYLFHTFSRQTWQICGLTLCRYVGAIACGSSPGQILYIQGFRQGVRTRPFSTTGGIFPPPPPCWQRKWKYFSDLAVISVHIYHFKHILKRWFLFSWESPPPPPTKTFLAGTLTYRSMPGKSEALGRCWFNVGPRRRWLASIDPALF